jgi:cytochrome P450
VAVAHDVWRSAIASRGGTRLVSAPEWDPYDPDVNRDPQASWKRLRQECPVYHNETYDFWALTRYQDIRQAFSLPDVFSSARGDVLELMHRVPDPPHSLTAMDGERHKEERSAIASSFSTKTVSDLEEPIRRICRSLIDEFSGDSIDVVRDYSKLLAMEVVCNLLGLPPDKGSRQRLLELVDVATDSRGELGIGRRENTRALMSMTAVLRRLYASGEIVAPPGWPEPVVPSPATHAQTVSAASTALLLLIAGVAAVARLIGAIVETLSREPDLLSELKEDPRLVHGVVEEAIRVHSPSPLQARLVTTPYRIGDTELPAGARVLLVTGSAGRDESVFTEPDEFEATRSERPHLGFGHGSHYCLGANLARLEARIAIEELLVRFSNWTTIESESTRTFGSPLQGWTSLTVELVD